METRCSIARGGHFSSQTCVCVRETLCQAGRVSLGGGPLAFSTDTGGSHWLLITHCICGEPLNHESVPEECKRLLNCTLPPCLLLVSSPSAARKSVYSFSPKEIIFTRSKTCPMYVQLLCNHTGSGLDGCSW